MPFVPTVSKFLPQLEILPNCRKDFFLDQIISFISLLLDTLIFILSLIIFQSVLTIVLFFLEVFPSLPALPRWYHHDQEDPSIQRHKSYDSRIVYNMPGNHVIIKYRTQRKVALITHTHHPIRVLARHILLKRTITQVKPTYEAS